MRSQEDENIQDIVCRNSIPNLPIWGWSEWHDGIEEEDETR